MMNDKIQQMINDTIQDINDGNDRAVKSTITSIINDIVNQQKIIEKAQSIISDKQLALKAIQEPRVVLVSEIVE